MEASSPKLSSSDLMLIEQRVTNARKSTGTAYFLWFFLGIISAHRFYLGRKGSAIVQILLNCVVIGLIWTVFDGFLIPGMIRSDMERERARLIDAMRDHKRAEALA